MAHALIGNVEECQYLEEEIFPLLLIENRPTIKCIVLHNFLCFHGDDAPESIVAEYKKAKRRCFTNKSDSIYSVAEKHFTK